MAALVIAGGAVVKGAASRGRDRPASTVANYLAEWVRLTPRHWKPKTLAGDRHEIDHYTVLRIAHVRLQAVRPAVISKLYRDLTDHGDARRGRSRARPAPGNWPAN